MKLSKEVMDIRTNWAIGDAKRDEGLTTPDDIVRYDDISYGEFGKENLMDIYHLKGVDKKQATIFNIHGGAWVYGCKEIYQFYCMSLAQRGFTVVNINYRLAPESHFPSPIEDVNNALWYLTQNGDKYNVDIENMILVGDSAGAQLTSHYAAIFTNPEFAKCYDLELPPVKIKALGLNCGIYDARELATVGLRGTFIEYLGYENGTKLTDNEEELLDKIDIMKHMTSSFPPSFVMTAANDFLHDCAKPMYEKLLSLGVDAKMKEYGRKEQEEVAHVFHINIKLPEATACNDDECEFFKEYV